MATPAELVDVNGDPLYVFPQEFEGVVHKILVSSNPQKLHGLFKAVTLGAVDTTRLATPKGNGYIELTDLIITTEKKTASILSIWFYDGTNKETVIEAYLADSTVNIAIAFTGGWSGWQGAYVEVDMAGAAGKGSAAIGFIKHVETFAPTYTEWVERRS
ncbi:hypothetical protein LCGC14_1250710 [marine sediment metagenome]|uniref:Uncharacterized protein n=1 Tax=marine sediment metagenome TaxID=412755 RepID=A0A0F9LPV5_9ZZZZ